MAAAASASASDEKKSSKIQLFSLGTPNGMKVSIALEEMELPYDAHKVDITKGEQFKPEFLKVNPNNKIPAITDPNGPGDKPISVFESGAILLYLAEKSGKFLPTDPTQRWETIQWLFWQMAGLGPMFGQFGHFYKYAKEKIPYAIDRYATETRRLLKVLDTQLEGKEYVIGSEYTIADMSIWGWVRGLDVFYNAKEYLKLDEFPNVNAWLERVGKRPAVQRGIEVCKF